jgi:hypothetical protein
MAITSYTRSPKETPININISKQLGQLVNNYRQDQENERQDRKESEASYLKQAKVDPVFNMSSYWQKEQGDKIKEFQDFLTNVYHRSENKPTLDDQIDIQNHKQALYGWQQKLKANQQQYAQAAKIIQNDPYGIKYDRANFKNKIDKWQKTGELDDDILLPPRIGDRKGYYEGKNWLGLKEKTFTDPTGNVHTGKVAMSEDEIKSQIKNDLFDPKNIGLYRTVTEDFSKLPIEEKKKYLDKHQGSDKLGDAIADWNYDTAGKYAVKENKNTTRLPSRSGSGQRVVSSINYDSPSDKIQIKGSADNPEDVDVWGGVDLPTGRYGVVSSRQYFDMETGEKKKANIGQDIPLVDPYIKYVPIAGTGLLASGKNYLNEKGGLKNNFYIKPVLVTKGDYGSIGLDLTPELKTKLKTRFPKLAKDVEDIPMEIKPKAGQQPEEEKAQSVVKKTNFDKYKRK